MIYEFRQNGELRMIRIVPTFGKPYYLVPADPTKGFGDLQRVDALVPSWVLWEFEWGLPRSQQIQPKVALVI